MLWDVTEKPLLTILSFTSVFQETPVSLSLAIRLSAHKSEGILSFYNMHGKFLRDCFSSQRLRSSS